MVVKTVNAQMVRNGLSGLGMQTPLGSFSTSKEEAHAGKITVARIQVAHTKLLCTTMTPKLLQYSIQTLTELEISETHLTQLQIGLGFTSHIVQEMFILDSVKVYILTTTLATMDTQMGNSHIPTC